MRKIGILVVVLALALLLVPAGASAGASVVRADLSGANEVPPSGSPAVGSAVVKVQGDSLFFRVTGRLLSGPAFGAHIHAAPAGVNGSIIVGLCGLPVAAAKPSCAKPDGKFYVQGLITPALAAANGTTVPALWAAIQTGDTYVNIHTDAFPGGELRGQLIP